jgi:superfamily II DNA or RNA helicase
MQTEDLSPWRLRVEPRAWQLEALDRWQSNEHRGIARVVTGAGKTVFAEMCMAELHRRQPHLRVLIVCPTLALVDQWYAALEDELGLTTSHLATYSGEGFPDRPALVNLMTLNAARTKAPSLAAEAPTFIIVDEAHRIGSPANSRALEAQYVASLGLSATPEREYDEAFEEIIAPSLGDIIYTYDYNRARREGVIAPFNLVNVKVNLSSSESEQYDDLTNRIRRLVRARGDSALEDQSAKRLLQMRAQVSATARMRIPVALRLIDDHPRQRLLVFHEQIAAARLIHAGARKRHSVALYHSAMSPALRRDNLRLFRRGVFDVLVTCRALDEGVNVPETSVAVIASSTASIRQRIQRLGRVLRPAEGKTEATVYTLYATGQEEKRLRIEAERMVEASSVTWLRSEKRTLG